VQQSIEDHWELDDEARNALALLDRSLLLERDKILFKLICKKGRGEVIKNPSAFVLVCASNAMQKCS